MGVNRSRSARSCKQAGLLARRPSGTTVINVTKQQREDELTVDGVVLEALPNAMFRVRLDNGPVILGHIAGKMRVNKIRVLPADRVQVVLSVYDLTRGRIVYRHPTH